jgi:hypothetical protein
MRQIAGVNEKVRSRGACPNPVQGSLEGCRNICVGWLVKTNVAVADLDKAEVGLGSGVSRAATKCMRERHSSHETPNHSGARPCHAFQEPTPIDSVGTDALWLCFLTARWQNHPIFITLAHALSFPF